MLLTHDNSWLMTAEAMRILLQEDVVIQENVTRFPTEWLLMWLGALYYIDVSCFSPFELGWPVTRPRKYTIMRHRYKTKAWKCPFNIFTSTFAAPTLFGEWSDSSSTPAWDVFFIATAADLFAELVWASSRPESSFNTGTASHDKPAFLDSFEQFVDTLMTSPMKVHETFHNCLTLVEKEFLIGSGATSQVCSLNQSPEFSAGSHWNCLHCLIRNAGILWSLARITSTLCVVRFHFEIMRVMV